MVEGDSGRDRDLENLTTELNKVGIDAVYGDVQNDEYGPVTIPTLRGGRISVHKEQSREWVIGTLEQCPLNSHHKPSAWEGTHSHHDEKYVRVPLGIPLSALVKKIAGIHRAACIKSPIDRRLNPDEGYARGGWPTGHV